MTLGADISDLSADPRTAASKGLSIVVPLYNEGAGLARLHERIAALAATLKQTYGLLCEVVYVDDGSADDTLSVARRLPATILDVNVISLSRNFGKEAALMAGLDHARRGGAVLFMDGDGQHPPALVETLVRHWIEDGYDVVYTAKAHRKNEVRGAAPCGQEFLLADELPRPAQDTAGRRRLPPALTPRRCCAATASRAQPLLQGAVELDRI